MQSDKQLAGQRASPVEVSEVSFREATAKSIANAVRVSAAVGERRGTFIVAVDGGDWFLQSEEDRQALAEGIAAGLGSAEPAWNVCSLELEHSAGSAQTQAVFASFIASLPRSLERQKQKLLGYLETIPWSAGVAHAMADRVAKMAPRVQWVLLVPAATGLAESRSSELVEAVLHLSRAIQARAVVFTESRVDLRPHTFCRIPAPVLPLPDFLSAAEKRLLDVPRDPQLGKRTLLSRLLSLVRREPAHTPLTDLKEWVAFVAQCSYPHLRQVDEIVVQMSLAQDKIARWSDKQLAKFGRSALSQRRFQSQREELRGRAWFLAILYATYPEDVDRARHSLSGGFALYGAQLRALANERRLGTAAGMSSLPGAGKLTPFFQRAMSATQALRTESAVAERALVTRFPSASALRRHIDWQFGAAALEEAGLRTWEDWIEEHIPVRIADLAEGRPVRSLETKQFLRDEENTYPEALLERAAWLLEIVELERPSQIATDEDVRRQSMSSQMIELLERADGLVVRALTLSDSAMRFEALIIRSRVLALKGQGRDARECIKTARKLFTAADANPASMALAAMLADAYVEELLGSPVDAPKSYSRTARAADSANADEILWRAVFGAMRCDFAQRQHLPLTGPLSPQQAALRAQMLLQVQTSRSPRLIDLVDPSAKTLFISYRSESLNIVDRLVQEIGEELATWFDKQIRHEVEDFAPAIQQQLSNCRAALFVVSRKFWESPYCCSEMCFITSRSAMTASRVPILWLVVDDEPVPGSDVEARAKFTDLIHAAAAADRNGALLRFLSDVAKNRVLETGVSAFEFALKATRSGQDGLLRWTDDAGRIEQVAKALSDRFITILSSASEANDLLQPE